MTIRRSKNALSEEPALSIFESSEVGLAEGDGFGQEGLGALDNDLHGDAYSDNMSEDLPESDVVDFDLDLSDSGAGSGGTGSDEGAPADPVASATTEADMQFDVEPESDDLHDIHSDDMGFEFDDDSDGAEALADTASADDSGELDLGMDEPAEIVADFDLDSDDETEIEESLDSPFESEESLDLEDSLEMDLSLDEEDDSSLDLDLDPPPEK